MSLPVTGWVSHFSSSLSFCFPSIHIYIIKDILCQQNIPWQVQDSWPYWYGYDYVWLLELVGVCSCACMCKRQGLLVDRATNSFHFAPPNFPYVSTKSLTSQKTAAFQAKPNNWSAFQREWLSSGFNYITQCGRLCWCSAFTEASWHYDFSLSLSQN